MRDERTPKDVCGEARVRVIEGKIMDNIIHSKNYIENEKVRVIEGSSYWDSTVTS